jgi:AraC-like DNA-binding protein
MKNGLSESGTSAAAAVHRDTSVAVQAIDDLLIERYRYPPGPASGMSTHVHEHWQWCLYAGGPGSYEVRAGRVVFPSGTLTVIPPGEPHAARDPEERRDRSECLVVYLPAERIPAHRGVVVDDPQARAAFVRLWPAVEPLEAQEAMAEFLALVDTEQRAEQIATPAARGVRIAREYLHEHAADRISLERLATVAGLSPAHLVRAFGRAYGLPPHRYQISLRIDRAKRLLIGEEVTVGEVAHAAGFADHAHFTRMFRRWVGLPPSRYAKIVQDSEPRMRLDHRP